MKTTSKLVTLLLIGTCLFGGLHAQALGPSADCSSANLFLTWLDTVVPGAKLSAVNTTRPTGGWEVCDTTWGTTGTCCDVTKLKSAFNKRTTEIKNGWQRFITGLGKFRSAIARLKAARGTNAKANLQAMSADSANYNLQGLTADQAETVVNKLDTLDTDLTTFRSKAAACFEATKKIRGAIFCNGCLNGASFSKPASDLVYTFRTGTCNDAIKACAPIWNFMVNIQSQLVLAVELKRKSKNGAGTRPTAPKVPKSKLLGNLVTQLADCPTGELSTSCTQTKLDEICGTFISFKNPETVAEEPNTTDLSTATAARLLQASPSGGETAAAGSADDGTGSASANAGISLNAETKPVADSTSVDATNAGNESAFGNIISFALMAFLCKFALIL